jgi:hypothetical protein
MAVRYFGWLWQIKSPSLEISPKNGMTFKLGSAGVCLDTAKCTVAYKASLLRQKVQGNKAASYSVRVETLLIARVVCDPLSSSD